MADEHETTREAIREARDRVREAAEAARAAARKARGDAHEAAREARRAAERVRRDEMRGRWGTYATHAAPAPTSEKARVRVIEDPEIQLTFNSRSILGVLFAATGAAFLAESIGLIDFKRVYIWPMLLIAMGLSQLLGRSERQKVEKKRSTQLAVAEERVKIARELHDIVAHSVSLMTIQIAAARRVFSIKPEQAKSALESAEETGRQSLNELRNILNVLRSADRSLDELGERQDKEEVTETKPLPGLNEVPALIESVRQAGTEVVLSIDGDQPQVPPSIGVTVYRIVQEALTNAIRHAAGAKVKVELSYSSSNIGVVVMDDGPGSEGPRGDGHGLIGMRERVQAVGGTLSAGPTGTGWKVAASIPVDAR